MLGWQILSRNVEHVFQKYEDVEDINMLITFLQKLNFCYIIITQCRHVWWWGDHMISSDQTSGRHQPDTGTHILHQESQCLATRDTGICGDGDKSKILSRRKREGEETNGHNKSCWLTSLLGSIPLLPRCCLAFLVSLTNQRKLGNKSDNCTDQSGDTPSAIQLVFNCPGQWSDNGGPETENEQECRCRGR